MIRAPQVELHVWLQDFAWLERDMPRKVRCSTQQLLGWEGRAEGTLAGFSLRRKSPTRTSAPLP